MIKEPEGFYDLVVECKNRCLNSLNIDRKDVTDEDIWDSASFVVFLRLGGMLDEAKSHYLKRVVEDNNSELVDREILLQTPFPKWSEKMLNLIAKQKSTETDQTKIATLNIIRPSNDSEAPIRRLYDDLFNFSEFIKSRPLRAKYVNSLPDSKDNEFIAEIAMNVRGIGFTKATIFCYCLGIGNNFSAVSGHVKSFVDDGDDYYVVNHKLQTLLLKYQEKDKDILMRHIDLAIYTLYVGRGQLFQKHKKSEVTPRHILDWINFKKINLDRFLDIIADLDLINQYSGDFTEFVSARL